MKVLSYLNVSNFENISSDSGYIFNYLLAKEFIKNNNEFAIILPKELKNTEQLEKCKIYYAQIGTTKYQSRFNFVWEEILKNILDFKPDVILLNQCELTAAIKALLITNNLNNIKIVTYCHYPALQVDENNKAIIDYTLNDSYIGETITFSILAAINVADVFITQSNFAKNLIKDYAKQHKFRLNKEIQIIPPPYDPFLYNRFNVKADKSNIIIYNHRLYYSYGTDKLLEIIDYNKEKFFYVLNPMSNRSKQRESLNNTPSFYVKKLDMLKNVKVINGSIREVYKSAILQSKVGLACYRKACVWSMSAVDCICLNVPVIAPDFAAYKEFIPKFLRFRTIEEAKLLINKLINDKDFYFYSIKKSRLILKRLSPNAIYKKLFKLIIGD